MTIRYKFGCITRLDQCHIFIILYIDFINVLQKINMVKLTFFLSGGSQEGADLVAPDVFEFGLSKCSFQQRVTLLFFFLSYLII